MSPINRGLDTELGEAKYARIELERRWLVDPDATPDLSDAYQTWIDDRYIDGTRMRLRRMRRPDLDEIKWKLTKKYECVEPRARPIVTTYLTQAEYDLLLCLPAYELAKVRHHFLYDGRWWSLDAFAGALDGLRMVECEADDLNELDALKPPSWALREVTDLAQWQCGALAAAQAIPED